nr:MAG TPA: hypothetical protein [Bacteriophage sp.]
MQQTPAFRPMSADTFSDWSIEAGDIISVDADGVVHPFPVFTSELDWAGAAKSTLSCDGSQARQPLRKQERREAAAFGAVSREIAKTDGKILEARNELIAALTGADGAPEDLAAGLQNYVRYDLTNKEGYAESVLFAQIGEKARAEINLYTVKSGDKAKTFAEILADLITLQGKVKIDGTVRVENGQLNVDEDIYTKGDVDADGSIYAQGGLGCQSGPFRVGGRQFDPTQITSTTGTVLVLGTA